jgi:hypothetical protein
MLMKIPIQALVLALLILIGVGLMLPARAAGVTVSIDPTTQQFTTVYVGQTIQVNINCSNIQDLWSWCISNLSFNSNVLNLTQVHEGPFLKEGGQTLFIWTSESPLIQNGTVPEISDTLLENSTASGSGVLATLTFNVVSAGNSQITLTNTTLLDPNEITPNVDDVTGVFEQINGTSINGDININAILPGTPVPTDLSVLSDPSTQPANLNTALYVGIAVVAAILIAVALFLKRRK